MSQVQKPQTLRGKTAWWAALAVVFIVAVLAFLILVKPAPQATPQAGETLASQQTGGCDVPAGDTSSKPAMPSDLHWEAKNGWTWPVSDTYGPTQKKDGYGICFARSPLGAALTAVSMNASANLINAHKAGETYLMDSKGKDALLARTPDGPANTSPASFAGFVVDSFNEDEASITLVIATAASSSGYSGLPLTFRWVNGDWKLRVLDDGSMFVGQPPVPTKGSFVEWSKTDG